ncbi:MAG: hypothetical protein GWN07_29145, partial [Actinobacteria bacterium]|nr:hypothetical protein [Actinomycetota bacterium]NIX23669.1 hypothetical protein [Actinomycetota bacterium]
MTRDRLLMAVPATLLILVAGWQAVRVETHDQSPWAGGGFAMFSYVDAAAYRPLIAYPTDDPSDRVVVPADMARERDRLLAAPTNDRAAGFAATLSARVGVAVTVEVWRPLFVPDGLVVEAD